MASENKKRKGKNSFIYNLGLKNDGIHLKKIQFFTPQDRKRNKKVEEASF